MILLGYLIVLAVRVHDLLARGRWTTADEHAYRRECAQAGGQP